MKMMAAKRTPAQAWFPEVECAGRVGDVNIGGADDRGRSFERMKLFDLTCTANTAV